MRCLVMFLSRKWRERLMVFSVSSGVSKLTCSKLLRSFFATLKCSFVAKPCRISILMTSPSSMGSIPSIRWKMRTLGVMLSLKKLIQMFESTRIIFGFRVICLNRQSILAFLGI